MMPYMDAPAASARGDPTEPVAQNASIESRRASQCSAGTWQNPPPEWPSVAGSQWVSLAWPQVHTWIMAPVTKTSRRKVQFWLKLYICIHE